MLELGILNFCSHFIKQIIYLMNHIVQYLNKDSFHILDMSKIIIYILREKYINRYFTPLYMS